MKPKPTGNRLAVLLMFLAALAGCRGEEEARPKQAADSLARSDPTPGEAVGVWAVTDDATALVLDRRLGADTTSVEELVAAVNQRYPRPEYPGVALDSVGGGTAYVRVIDGAQLGQRMGTTGSAAYLAAVTFSLTSLPSVDGVYFSFEEGAHARPGRYTRAEWHGYFEAPAE